jgi:excinuclease ABC subunit C
MFDQKGLLIYVGKAKNLQNRVGSYFRSRGLNTKTLALVNKIHSIETTITHSETEALLLEHNLIKAHRPPYNILLRDDKSYPHIFLSAHAEFPLLTYKRGSKTAKGQYFGPYPSGGAVKESILLLQKIFKLRNCEDSFFSNRSRPCLQHQIDRCSAPCVGLISKEQYAEDLSHAVLFLKGKNTQLMETLKEQMDHAASDLLYEKAALLRDQISSLRAVQEKQYVTGGDGDADILAIAIQNGSCCVHQLSIRNGHMLGSNNHFPRLGVETEEAEVLFDFAASLYLGKQNIPTLILLNKVPEGEGVLAQALTQDQGKNIKVASNVRGDRAKWVSMAETNATESLRARLASKASHRQRYKVLQDFLQIEKPLKHLECFDISHTQGEATVASCVVFDQNGPKNRDYRLFNIEGITGGDDYAAMHQAITRRYSRILKENKSLPDLLVVDGGKGQYSMAIKVAQDLGIESMPILGVAKGVTRKAGMEVLIWKTKEVKLPADSEALHLLQHIRDESHRFAISGHRQQRGKARKVSTLDSIPGIGPAKRKALLRHFGALQSIMGASKEELSKAPGISKNLASILHSSLHDR